MSRNLGETSCYYCNSSVILEEEPRLITEKEAHRYYEEYKGMKVANAICPNCCAKYLAWCSDSDYHRSRWGSYIDNRLNDKGFADLSFRSTFNDEPGYEDLPLFKIEFRPIRIGPWEEKFPNYSCPRDQYVINKEREFEKYQIHVKEAWEREISSKKSPLTNQKNMNLGEKNV